MAHIANTFFELKNTNLPYNAMQNLAGTFQTSGTADICPSGLICIKAAQLPIAGYPNVNNGNAWIFNAAASGAPSATGEVPELYAYNSYDVNKVGDGEHAWMVGANTAGLELPAGEVGTFTKLIAGEQAVFGSGNFSTLPTDLATTKYATLASGLLVASATVPAAGAGFWFEITAKVNPTVGTRSWGTAYRVIIHYNGPAAAAGG